MTPTTLGGEGRRGAPEKLEWYVSGSAAPPTPREWSCTELRTGDRTQTDTLPTLLQTECPVDWTPQSVPVFSPVPTTHRPQTHRQEVQEVGPTRDR